ncbi:MAG TPA: hypothetical protein VLD67_17985, partial [Vicinamibacterales bacterium]|nr:hypothetical protein [Vicinamibacterales bacterium]
MPRLTHATSIAAFLVAAALSGQQPAAPPPPLPDMSVPAGAARIEQTSAGEGDRATLVAGFEGLGESFEGPQGKATLRNPSDNSIAVGPDHVMVTVNSRMAIFTKKGRRFDTSGTPLYGPVNTNNVFRGFGGQCEALNNGDVVVRYDQLADRWLIVMPLFRRGPVRADQPPEWRAADTAYTSPPGVAGQPGRAVPLYQPPPPDPSTQPTTVPRPPGGRGTQPGPQGPYSMCYAISVGPDPFGPYYRYEFLRPLFPDYPRTAVWTDGYYTATSTGDDVIQKHACVVERARMVKGEPASELCFVIDGVNFLNNADIDGTRVPPRGAPNIMMATGGTQLKEVLEDDGVYAWNIFVDWKNPEKTRLAGPVKITVAPYRYLCGGQLTHCVPQPGSERRLDAQGDKIMSRLVYRRLRDRESIVAVHSVNTAVGGGGVRWYELTVNRGRSVALRQQGTYAPDGYYRWMATPAIDR